MTKEKEGNLACWMVLDKVRKVFCHCQGLRLGIVAGVTATAFQVSGNCSSVLCVVVVKCHSVWSSVWSSVDAIFGDSKNDTHGH